MPDSSDSEVKDDVEGSANGSDDLKTSIARKSEELMDYLQLGVVLILLVLFGIGVYDIAVKLVSYVVTGQIFDPVNIIAVLETALLLFLVVEVFRTAVAQVEDLKVLPLVIDVAIIGVVRSIITFRLGAFQDSMSALVAAAAYAVILLALIASFYIVHRQERKEPDSHPPGEDGREN